MNEKFRIAIAGIGGVGGYVGGKLATKYHLSSEIEIIFIARGENEKVIQKNGLKLITPQGEETCFPAIITHELDKTGPVDLLICCVKNYDLENTFKTLSPYITDSTIILPLANGLDTAYKINFCNPLTGFATSCIILFYKHIVDTLH